MATTTTHYSLKKYEGADLFNPLTYENANADAIDQAMYDNKQQAVGSATELASGTVHALTRGNTDSPIFAFTATSNFVEGDTFTVDGTPVTALTTSGETLPGGAYVIGAQVIGFLRSTQLTLFVYKKPASTIAAGNVTYDNTSSGLTATDAQAAIDELDTKVDTITTSTNIATQITASDLVNLDSVTVSQCFKYGKLLIMNVTCAVNTINSPISFKLNFPGTINPVGMTFQALCYSGWTAPNQSTVLITSNGTGGFSGLNTPYTYMQFNVVIPYSGQ